jgi:hypothetical protein
MSPNGWRSSTDASTMLKGVIAQHHPSERELRLFSSACVRLTLEMVESLDEKTRTEAMLIVEFVERMAEDELQPPPGSELANLAEVAELEDHFCVRRLGYCSPLHPNAAESAYWGIHYALGAYREQQVCRTKEATDPEFVRAIEERVMRARDGLRLLSPSGVIIVRLAGLIGRGEALKRWLEKPKGFDATTRASFSRMAAAKTGAPWVLAEQEARITMQSRLCALMLEFFDGDTPRPVTNVS